MTTTTTLCTGLTMASGGMLVSARQAALAQADVQTLKRLMVTGSNIKRKDTETASGSGPDGAMTRLPQKRT